MIYRTNETHGYMTAYTFTLVLEGRVTLLYNGQELTLQPDDIYLYSPGLPVTVIDASDNYRGICLLADDHMTIDSPTVHDLVHIAYAPIVRLREPKITLSHADALQMADKMHEIINYLHSSNIYKAEIVRMLYAIFLLNLQNAQEKVIHHRGISQHTEDIFVSFIRLLPKYFREHHDIGFYADKLHISTVYLSRIVRQITGRTVIGYINQMLLMEASFLLQSSKLSIAQISDQLHFSEPSSFTRFFIRMKGVSPKDFREKKR